VSHTVESIQDAYLCTAIATAVVLLQQVASLEHAAKRAKEEASRARDKQETMLIQAAATANTVSTSAPTSG
jgi:hypothetical protein